MKYIIYMLVVLFLSACNNEIENKIQDGKVNQSVFKKTCIDGVYYLVGTHMLSPWVSGEDLKFHNCK
jgi:hypothetical protein